jgi:SSS family solute:Na+ symporter
MSLHRGSLIAVAVYVIVSLLTCKEDYNMDRMLHRGKYARETDPAGDRNALPMRSRGALFERAIGIDENFTRSDKWIAGGLLCWSLFWCAIVIIGSIWNLISPWSVETWSAYWHFAGIVAPITLTFITGVWFTIGGLRDMRLLFKRLREEKVNHMDDGTVIGHQNLDDAAMGHDSPSGRRK